MKTGRKDSAVIALTLAEFAWLVVFGVLLLLKSRDGEIARMKQDRDAASQQATTNVGWQEKYIDMTKQAVGNQQHLDDIMKSYGGLRPEQITNLLTETDREKSRIQKERDDLTLLLALATAHIRAESNAALQALHLSAIQTEKVESLQRQLDGRLADEFSIRREITGLPAGPLRRVVILLDTSSSMHGSSAWKDAMRLVRVWLTYLPIEQCVLVTFDDNTRVFPREGFLRLRDEGGVSLMTTNQDLLLAKLDGVQLGTYTDTLKALETAYRFPDISLILLFTDGKPKARTASFENLSPRITKLVIQHQQIPILAVALGDYEKLEIEDKRAGMNLQIEFLKRIAKLSHGAFMAR